MSAMASEQVELLERVRVEQIFDPLAGKELALLVLALHGTRRPGVVRLLLALAKVVQSIVHRIPGTAHVGRR
jgi:hypothetical protein